MLQKVSCHGLLDQEGEGKDAKEMKVYRGDKGEVGVRVRSRR